MLITAGEPVSHSRVPAGEGEQVEADGTRDLERRTDGPAWMWTLLSRVSRAGKHLGTSRVLAARQELCPSGLRSRRTQACIPRYRFRLSQAFKPLESALARARV